MRLITQIMNKETTYNKYKRENKELKQIVAADVRFFCMGQQDFSNRLSFIKKMMLQYRVEQDRKNKYYTHFSNTKDALEYMKTHKNTTIIIDEAGTKRLGKSKLSLKMIRLLRATKKCQACEEDKPLEPHRIIRGNKGGLYTVYKLDDKGSNVKMLCKDCHKKLHANENKHVSHSY